MDSDDLEIYPHAFGCGNNQAQTEIDKAKRKEQWIVLDVERNGEDLETTGIVITKSNNST